MQCPWYLLRLVVQEILQALNLWLNDCEAQTRTWWLIIYLLPFIYLLLWKLVCFPMCRCLRLSSLWWVLNCKTFLLCASVHFPQQFGLLYRLSFEPVTSSVRWIHMSCLRQVVNINKTKWRRAISELCSCGSFSDPFGNTAYNIYILNSSYHSVACRHCRALNF